MHDGGGIDFCGFGIKLKLGDLCLWSGIFPLSYYHQIHPSAAYNSLQGS